MTSHQKSDLATYLACYAVACLCWEAYALMLASSMTAMGEINALRTYDMPVADAYMGYATEGSRRAGMMSAAVVALALACSAAFSARVRGRAGRWALALAVGAYAVSGLPVSVAALGLLRMATGDEPSLPLDMALPRGSGFDTDIMQVTRVSDVGDALEAAVALGVLLARVGAVAVAVALVLPWPRRGGDTPAKRFAVPAAGIPKPANGGGVRTSGG